jgi:HSP20 family molecular chaperone IbpA
MSNLNQITHNLRDSVDHLAEGWQQMWNKGKNAITRFTPRPADDSAQSPIRLSNRWGVLSAELKETASNITIMLEVPGMESDDFDIQIDKSSLRVSGHKAYASDKTKVNTLLLNAPTASLSASSHCLARLMTMAQKRVIKRAYLS